MKYLLVLFIGITTALAQRTIFDPAGVGSGGSGGSATNALVTAAITQFTTNGYKITFITGAQVTNLLHYGYQTNFFGTNWTFWTTNAAGLRVEEWLGNSGFSRMLRQFRTDGGRSNIMYFGDNAADEEGWGAIYHLIRSSGDGNPDPTDRVRFGNDEYIWDQKETSILFDTAQGSQSKMFFLRMGGDLTTPTYIFGSNNLATELHGSAVGALTNLGVAAGIFGTNDIVAIGRGTTPGGIGMRDTNHSLAFTWRAGSVMASNLTVRPPTNGPTSTFTNLTGIYLSDGSVQLIWVSDNSTAGGTDDGGASTNAGAVFTGSRFVDSTNNGSSTFNGAWARRIAKTPSGTIDSTTTNNWDIRTNASIELIISGSAAPGQQLRVGVSNYAATTIFITNTAGILRPSVGSNVSLFAIPGNSKSIFDLQWNTNDVAAGRWEIVNEEGLQMELGPGVNNDLSTNGAMVSMVSRFTISTNGAIVGSQTNLNILFGTNIIAEATNRTGTVDLRISSAAGGGASTAWDAIGDPAGDGTIAFGGTQQIITSSRDSAVSSGVFVINNTDADNANETALISLSFVDTADAQSIFLLAISDATGAPLEAYRMSDTVFNVASHITSTFSGPTAVPTATTGDNDTTAASTAFVNASLVASNYVTIAGNQTITGTKTFSAATTTLQDVNAQGLLLTNNVTFITANLNPTGQATNYQADYTFGWRTLLMTNACRFTGVVNVAAADLGKPYLCKLRNLSGGALRVSVDANFRRSGTNDVSVGNNQNADVIITPDGTGGSNPTNHTAQIILYDSP